MIRRLLTAIDKLLSSRKQDGVSGDWHAILEIGLTRPTASQSWQRLQPISLKAITDGGLKKRVSEVVAHELRVKGIFLSSGGAS